MEMLIPRGKLSLRSGDYYMSGTGIGFVLVFYLVSP
jgi:hypothetical protein